MKHNNSSELPSMIGLENLNIVHDALGDRIYC